MTNTQLAYIASSHSGTSSDIYLYTLETKSARNLTNSTARGQGNYTPAWSPDGSMLAWAYLDHMTYQNELRIMDVEGKVLHELPARGFDHPPVWSPDGKQLAYQLSPSTIHVLNLTDMSVRILNSTQRIQSEEFAWSPDSTRIACVLLRDDFYQLAIISVEADQAFFPLEKGYHIEEIRWFDIQTLRAVMQRGQMDTYEYSICNISLDGTITPLYRLDPNEHSLIKLSPKGTKIAYFTYIPIPINEVSVYQGGLGDLYLINDDGSNRRHLLHRATPASLMAWSQDEHWLACDSNFASDLYIVSMEDGQQQSIGEQCSDPAWRPTPSV